MATDRPGRGDSDADIGDDDRVRDDDYERDFGAAEPPDPLGQASLTSPKHTSPRPAPRGRHAVAGRGEREERAARQRPPVVRATRCRPAPTTARPRCPRPSLNEPAHPRKGLFGRAADFLRASYAELRRVQWPDRRQVGQGTAVTLGFVVVAGAYLGLLDAIWNPIIQAIL